jgi:RNA polymerase sigma factor (sigma-70 family)
MTNGSYVDQIAVEVHQLLQAVSDDCENPHTLVLGLAQRVQDRRQGGAQLEAAASSVNAAAAERRIQTAFKALDPKAQEIMRLHLSQGSHYRQIAERLNMQPAHVLRILTEAYAKLRWHTEPVEPMTKSIAP